MPAVVDRVFVADQAPPGWRLGRWSQRDATGWEERKTDEPGVAYEFEVQQGLDDTPGSMTVRLRMKDANTEVLLLDRTAQIFVDGHYFGEYRGHWEVGGQELVDSRTGSIAAPRAAPGGAPQRSPQPGRQAPGGMQHSATGPLGQQPHGAHAMPHHASTLPPQALAASVPQDSAFGGPRIMPAANLDRSPEMVAQMYKAVESGQAEAVKRLLSAGADPNGVKEGRPSPLLMATSKGNLPIVQELLAAGADPYLGGGPTSDTPILVAFQKGHSDVLRALFKASFQTLEAAMSPGELASVLGFGRQVSDMEWDEEALPTAALQELHETTAKLLKLRAEPPVEDDYRRAHQEDEDVDMPVSAVREGAVRECLRSLMKASHLVQMVAKEVQEEDKEKARAREAGSAPEEQ